MAVIETIIDDLDKTPDATTREFSVDGVQYQIDLVEKNYVKLLKALQPFIDVATPVKKSQAKRSAAPAPPRTTRTAANGDGGLQGIRDWARANGKKVSDRGRPSREVMDAYHKAQGKQARSGATTLVDA